MKVTDSPIEVCQTFTATKEQVWQSITHQPEMVRWFFEQIPDFEAKVGFTTAFVVQNEGRTFTHLWEVTEVVPFERIRYNWKYKEYPGDSFVEFSLTEKGSTTQLTVKAVVTEDFPENIPEFKRESCEGGWKYFIKERLNEYFKP